MQKCLIRQSGSLFVVLFGLAVSPVLQAAPGEVLLPEQWMDVIPYKVTRPVGYSMGSVDGKTAYDDERKGVFDWEPMIEINPAAKPLDLPPPTVVPFIQHSVAVELNGQRIKSDRSLQKEDKIFLQIAEDEKKARCYILGEGCPEDTQE